MRILDQQIAIIGAGIGGLVAGIALGRAGFAVTIYEQSAQFGDVGAGITISPNADKVLAHIGLADALAGEAYVPERQWTQHWQTGAIVRDVARGPDIAAQYGGGYYHLHRADLHRILMKAFNDLPHAILRSAHRLEHVSADGKMTFTGDGVAHQADIIIAADGVKSVVRDQLFATQPAQYAGQVAWRGMVPVETLSADSKLRHPGIHIGPQRLVARYPVRNGDLINYVAFVKMQGWEDESWSIRSTIAELAGHYAGCDPQLMALIEATPADQLFKWALHARQPLEHWAAGKVTLLGDAAHAMLPFMGQGAGTAIEDAMILARCLTAYPREQAFASYQAKRLERTSMVQLNSMRMGLAFQGEDPADFGNGPILDEQALGLFAYDAVHEAI